MVQVRGYPDQQIQQQGLPSARLQVRATPDAFGAPIAQGVDRAVSIGAQIYHDEMMKQRKVQLNTFDLESQKVEESILYDPKTGALNTQGSQAFGIGQKSLSEYDKQMGEIADKIPDQEVKEAFRQSAAQRRQGMQSRLDQHEGKAYQEHDKQTFQARQEGLRVQAARDAGDLQAVDTTIGKMEMGIIEFGHRNGIAEEAIEQSRAEVRSGTHAQAILSLSDSGNYMAANQRFKDVSAKLLPEDKQKLERVLEVGTLRGEAQRGADEIMKANPTANDQELSDAVAKKFGDNPKMRDAVETRVANRKKIRDDAKEENNRNLFNSAFSIASNPNNHKGLDAVPITMQTALRESDPERYVRLGELIAKESRDIPIVTEWNTYNALRMQAAENPQQFTKANIPDFFDRLAPAERKEMIDLKASLMTKRDSPETQAKLAEIRGHTEVMKATLRSIGVDPTYDDKAGPDNKNNRIRVELDAALRRRVTGKQATTGKQLTQEEVQKEADALVLYDTFKTDSKWNLLPGFYDPIKVDATRRAFENPAISGQAFNVDQVPAEYHDQLAQALNADGFKLDANPAAYEAEMVRRYNLYLKQNNAR